MRVILEAGVDLYIRRGWYESTDFWSPALYRALPAALVHREAALAHEYGAPFGTIMTTGALPMMEQHPRRGRRRVDRRGPPAERRGQPLEAAHARHAGRPGSASGAASTVRSPSRRGREDEVRQAVGRRAGHDARRERLYPLAGGQHHRDQPDTLAQRRRAHRDLAERIRDRRQRLKPWADKLIDSADSHDRYSTSSPSATCAST